MNGDMNKPEEDKRVTVLVADDDEDILALVDRALSESGYEVLLARDGALTTVRERNPRWRCSTSRCRCSTGTR